MKKLEREVKNQNRKCQKGEVLYEEEKRNLISIIELDNHNLIFCEEEVIFQYFNTNCISPPEKINKYKLFIYRLEDNN